MNLHDPLRPILANGARAWIRNNIAIPPLSIYPLPDGTVRLSLFLPIRDEMFSSKDFSIIIHQEYLCAFIVNFTNDPEETCETYFKSPIPELMPELRKSPRRSNINNDNETHKEFRINGKSKIKTKILTFTNLDF